MEILRQYCVRAIIVHDSFFKFERPSSLEYLEIIRTKRGGLIGLKDGLIRFAQDLLTSHMERSFEPAIDMEIAALDILQKDHPRAVIENGLEACFTFTKFLRRPLPLGDVAHERTVVFLFFII